METLVESGMHKPILIPNPYESYWEQLEALQSALERDWVELGRTGRPLALHDLLKLEYTTTTSKSTNIIRQTQKSTNIITQIQTTVTSNTSKYRSPPESPGPWRQCERKTQDSRSLE